MTQEANNGPQVFIVSQEGTCAECGDTFSRHAWITLTEGKAVCFACSDLDHLVYLPAGDPALTRRARKHSTLSAPVLEWNRPRKRYERRGLLVEEAALEQAEQECLADSDVRARRREREAVRREELDQQYIQTFASRVHDLFPGCPADRATTIAEHACLKYSGRVGRSAAAKNLDVKAVRLAVIAHLRHTETNYDRLLAEGTDRRSARALIEGPIAALLAKWEKG